MKNRDLSKILKRFSDIEPSKGFSLRSKSLILSQARSMYRGEMDEVIAIRGFSGYLSLGTRIASFSLAGVLIIVAIYYTTRELSPVFLPGLNESKIVAEAQMINSNIDIQLSQIQHFKQASSESNSVLTQASVTQLSHLNENVIQKESTGINSSLPNTQSQTDQKLNSIINQISQ